LDIATELRDLAAPPGNRLEALKVIARDSTAFASTISGASALCGVMGMLTTLRSSIAI